VILIWAVVVIFSIAEIVDRYKKEQIVEGHVLSKPVVKVWLLSVFLTRLCFCAELMLKACKLTVGIKKISGNFFHSVGV